MPRTPSTNGTSGALGAFGGVVGRFKILVKLLMAFCTFCKKGIGEAVLPPTAGVAGTAAFVATCGATSAVLRAVAGNSAVGASDC